MNWRTQLLTLVEAYSAHSGLSEARIATMAVNQGAFFKRVRAGAGVTIDNYHRVQRWFAERWPEDLPWPEGCDRPGTAPREAA